MSTDEVLGNIIILLIANLIGFLIGFPCGEVKGARVALEKQEIHQRKLDETQALDRRIKQIEANQEVIRRFLGQATGGH